MIRNSEQQRVAFMQMPDRAATILATFRGEVLRCGRARCSSAGTLPVHATDIGVQQTPHGSTFASAQKRIERVAKREKIGTRTNASRETYATTDKREIGEHITDTAFARAISEFTYLVASIAANDPMAVCMRLCVCVCLHAC